VVLWVGRVPNKRSQLILQLNLNISLHLRRKKDVWVKKFIIELGVVCSIINPIALQCDNNGSIAQVNEPRSCQLSKHVLKQSLFIKYTNKYLSKLTRVDSVHFLGHFLIEFFFNFTL
jgi:hypothetical protein